LELSRGLNAVVSTYAKDLGVLHHGERFFPASHSELGCARFGMAA